MKIKPKVFVALSGGVDSSVAAALLKERGFDVCGAHIKMWSDPSIPCTTKEDRLDAMRVAAKLNIPFETWDFTEEYRQAVVDYMIQEYAAGRTPNPDVMCNSRIKFGVFLKRALEGGADYMATGHYVRLMRKFQNPNSKFQTNPKPQIKNSKIENYKLKIAKDTNKNQSYFLWTLTQKQLKHCLFPIGDYAKTEVRKLAHKFGLPTAEKKGSQGLCFVGKIDIREFLKSRICGKEGVVLTTSGKTIGRHDGLEPYTIGQRHGIGIGGGRPYFVAEKNFASNTLVVAESENDPALYRREVAAANINWVSGKMPRLPLQCQARIRYRQPLRRCRITRIDANATTNLHELIRKNSWQNSYLIRVTFDEPQRAVTPGQSIVFYKGDEMLGGGIIK